MGSGGSPPRSWLLLAGSLAILPVSGAFSTHRIFSTRDLSLFFWSRHLWLRHTLFDGELPWWDPHVAGGQSAIADALNQLLMPVTLAIRLLPSEVVAFNLWIALPLPIAAIGMFLFVRRRTPDAAAALGACAFALSGPAVSMLNAPNLSWAVALMPWVMLACDRLAASVSAGRVAALAGAFALQALCGEPVTWLSTAVVALVYSAFRPTHLRQGYGGPPERFARRRKAEATGSEEKDSKEKGSVASAFKRTFAVVAALVAGALLAAGQIVPTVMAGIRAQRAVLATPDFWSLHPFALWEAVLPRVFGDVYASLADSPWMGPLNFGRDPFFYSLYVGPLVLLLACAGVVTRFRRNAIWLAIALLFCIAALGGYTPLYPLARRLVPPMLYFRFPAKYIVISVFACAVLAAEGFAGILARRRLGSGETRLSWLTVFGGSLAALGLVLSLATLFMPDTVLRAAHWFALSAHLKDPAAGGVFLARVAPPLLARACALLLAGCVLIAAGARTRRAVVALFVLTCADLLFAGRGLNPTTDAAGLAPPAWYTASAGSQRVYIGGRVRGFMNPGDPDAASTWHNPAGRTVVEGPMALHAELPMAPSGWRVREALSYDLPALWPAEYEGAVRRFEQADAAERAAFLRRGGVRRCVVPATEQRQWRMVAEVPDWNMRVFECDPGATRAIIASSVEVSVEPWDLTWQRDALFDPGLRDDVARVPAMPAVAGRPGPPEPPFARIVRDGATTVVVEASAQNGGTLVLRDSYDPSWTADVDGVPAAIARANGLYRAVTLPPGRHVIRFSYRPRDLATGLIISGMTAALLTLAALAMGFSRFSRFKRFKNPESPERGFTLIELMVVLAIIAILLAISFSEYRGMQARGNDTSALASMRSIAAAQWQFALTCGNMKYASTLPALAKPVPSTGEGFLSPDLTGAEAFEKSGYMFQMVAKPLDSGVPACNGTVPANGYAATADPVNLGATGTYFYGLNADRIIYLDDKQTFTGNLPETGAPSHGAEVK
jgi:prepilin-type N-terminal cleavage/methylation domain-containing protein